MIGKIVISSEPVKARVVLLGKTRRKCQVTRRDNRCGERATVSIDWQDGLPKLFICRECYEKDLGRGEPWPTLEQLRKEAAP